MGGGNDKKERLQVCNALLPYVPGMPLWTSYGACVAEKEKRRLLRGHDRRCMAFFYALFICQSLGSAWRILFLFTTTAARVAVAETAAAVATTMPAYQADKHRHTHTHTHAHVQCVHVHIGPHSQFCACKKEKTDTNGNWCAHF